MYFLLNDIILDIEPARMMQPLDAERFSALSIDYIAQLGKEMFAEDSHAHRRNPERARRLCYLIHLKMPRVNAAQFFATMPNGPVESIDASFKSLNEMAMGLMYQQQMAGQLDAAKVDYEVWHRMAA
ncbi:hypothetical protein [Asticcacaulis sp. 201]|uniref:hypothetical protein n=1 Tax=Asticcacaulis sp. 201 TaxID=3028787 RepID=UPI002916FB0A|nr:hypothetical protein [Asticcacaulis sp. 201]MDV6331882.1 hypothetical protein [Asticcacaulis sp. 201]